MLFLNYTELLASIPILGLLWWHSVSNSSLRETLQSLFRAGGWWELPPLVTTGWNLLLWISWENIGLNAFLKLLEILWWIWGYLLFGTPAILAISGELKNGLFLATNANVLIGDKFYWQYNWKAVSPLLQELRKASSKSSHLLSFFIGVVMNANDYLCPLFSK